MSSRRRDLTPEQAAALRPLVARLCEGRGGQARLAEATGWDQANISIFLRGSQGVSYATAFKVCELTDTDAFEIMNLPRPPRLRALDMPTDEFLGRLAVAPGLRDTVFAHPRRWRLSTVVQALRTPQPTDDNGVPIGGWEKWLDGIQPDLAPEAAAPSERRRRKTSEPKAK